MVQEDMCSFISQSETEEIVLHVFHSDLSITQNFMDRGAWRATVHEGPKTWTRLRYKQAHLKETLTGSSDQ